MINIYPVCIFAMLLVKELAAFTIAIDNIQLARMSSSQYYLGTLRSLIGLQLVSRLASFSLNQSLLRIASPTVYGTAAIQFDLIRDTVLFLGREAVRGVVLRTHVVDDREKDNGAIESSLRASGTRRRILNMALLPPVLGLLVVFTIVPAYVSTLPDKTTSQSCYKVSLYGYLFSTVLELATEPFMLGTQIGLFALSGRHASSTRARIEGTGVVVRAVVTFACLFLAKQSGSGDGQALLGFAIGQIAYSMVLVGAWMNAVGHDGVHQVSSQAITLVRSLFAGIQ
jgi:oligosaccharide translocation protein RFT1